MIGLPATIACADGDPRPRRNPGEDALARQESGDCGVTATLPGFAGAAALQRPTRRLSFAGANREARMMRAALLSVIGVLLLGAAARAQPYIYHGNDTGGIIPWSCENEAMAQQLAAAYCARWDKYHRITSVHGSTATSSRSAACGRPTSTPTPCRRCRPDTAATIPPCARGSPRDPPLTTTTADRRGRQLHFTPWRASTSRTASTSLSSDTANCAGRLARHSWLEAIAAAALAPSIKSLICTSPLAFSSPPWITTQGAPRLSAYLSCGPILPEPR